MYKDEVSITGIGTGSPVLSVPQTEVVDYLLNNVALSRTENRLLKSIYLSSGIERRYSVLEGIEKLLELIQVDNKERANTCLNINQRMDIYKQHALKLASAAIRNCLDTVLDNNRYSEINITHLITVSCTGMYAPGLDIELIHEFNFDPSTQRTCINFMGCYGVFNALKQAQAICQSNPSANVLIVSVELCTLHIRKINSINDLISSAIFSDGAGALLIQNNARKTINQKSKPHSNKNFILNDFYCDLIPKGSADMTWDIGSHGFDIVLSTYVPELISSGISLFVKKLLHKNSLNIKDCRYYAIHPGGKKILEACGSALDINTADLNFSYDILRDFGNMSSATVIFVLNKIWNSLKPDDHNAKLFSCAFGPGLTFESLLLTCNFN